MKSKKNRRQAGSLQKKQRVESTVPVTKYMNKPGISRQRIHISRETYKGIVAALSDKGDSIEEYIDNVLRDHLQRYGDAINGLYYRRLNKTSGSL